MWISPTLYSLGKAVRLILLGQILCHKYLVFNNIIISRDDLVDVAAGSALMGAKTLCIPIEQVRVL